MISPKSNSGHQPSGLPRRRQNGKLRLRGLPGYCRAFRSHLVLAALLLNVAACGGGGGSDPHTSPPPPQPPSSTWDELQWNEGSWG